MDADGFEECFRDLFIHKPLKNTLNLSASICGAGILPALQNGGQDARPTGGAGILPA